VVDPEHPARRPDVAELLGARHHPKAVAEHGIIVRRTTWDIHETLRKVYAIF